MLDGGRHSAEAPSKKWTLEYDESTFKAINIAPSKLAFPSTFWNAMDLEHHGCEVYIYNRLIDFSSVLLTLISPIFGQLLDDTFSNNKLQSNNFAPARDLVNMLSILDRWEIVKGEVSQMIDWNTQGHKKQYYYKGKFVA